MFLYLMFYTVWLYSINQSISQMHCRLTVVSKQISNITLTTLSGLSSSGLQECGLAANDSSVIPDHIILLSCNLLEIHRQIPDFSRAVCQQKLTCVITYQLFGSLNTTHETSHGKWLVVKDRTHCPRSHPPCLLEISMVVFHQVTA
jgi:hypothetical protein